MTASKKWTAYRFEFFSIVKTLKGRGIDVDRLPYTPLFDELYETFIQRFSLDISRSEFFWQLVVVRKNYTKWRDQFLGN